MKIKFEDWMEVVVSKIIRVCGYGALTITFSKVKTDSVNNEDRSTVFAIDYDKMYKTAYISIYPIAERMFNEGRINDLIKGLTHEISHIITYPLYKASKQRFVSGSVITETNEEATENIAIILRRLIKYEIPEVLEQPRSTHLWEVLEKQKSKKAKK